ncbi:hypothetical protein [Candidatus Sodalis pierantonius]|uniref:hypothetical protein n=1 Tax=Candidatus Sodalis pierantonii TaxID=1486991 RepID=UPI0011DE20CE|nr:hypothetical protein [Candidatus Sodalis pierantonius]
MPEKRLLQRKKFASNFNRLPVAEKEDALISSYVSYLTWGDESCVSGLIKSYYQVHCLNCGHLSLYRSIVVLQWIANLEKACEVKE